jgi:hypothetical protein
MERVFAGSSLNSTILGTAREQLPVFLAISDQVEAASRGRGRFWQPIMPLDLPVKVRSWELTVPFAPG